MRMRPIFLPLTALLLALVPTLGVPATAGGDASGFWVVGFGSRITDDARAQLLATGARIIDYEPVDSFIVWASSQQAAAADRLAVVRSTAPLAASRKMTPELATRGLIPFAEVGIYAGAIETMVPALARLGRIARVSSARADGVIVTIGLPLRGADAVGLARDPRVLYIAASSLGGTPEDEATVQVQAGNLDANGRGVPGYNPWLNSLGLDGTGITAAVVDTGLSARHPDFEGRASWVNYSVLPDGIDDGGHGTHVAGILGGAPGQLTANLKDLGGFVYGQGVAPGAHIVSLNYLGLGDPPSFPEIAADALENGAHMWNASWYTGDDADARAGYVPNARIMDEIARDADPSAPGAQEFLLVFSAGNTGSAGPTQPKEAKNIIAVGATLSGRDLLSRGTAGNPAVVAGFSAVGPALDGRIFPTVVAPGDSVVSAQSPEGHSGLAGACIPPPLGALVYTMCSGTSMAAPHVTGAAALIHQWWLRERGVLPSTAMVKALLVNSAQDLATPNIPNNREGWGRVNLGDLFGIDRLVIDQAVALAEPDAFVPYEIEVADTDRPLRVTLAWSDAPAATGAVPALVNDLDLRVEQLDATDQVIATYHGNVFAGGFSVTGGAPDRLNNLENVYVKLPTGRYRITVSAYNLPGDGSSWNPDATDQDYALLINNAVLGEG